MYLVARAEGVIKVKEILVVGSVAYDSVTTQLESRKDALGGSATYFAISGSYFAPVSIVAVVGTDFGTEDLELLARHRVDTSGVKTAAGETFRWAGEYAREDVNSRRTLETHLNVFAGFRPDLSNAQKKHGVSVLGKYRPRNSAERTKANGDSSEAGSDGYYQLLDRR
jgi:sugar/nucleoside kinase (ribokinase family)